MQGPVLRSLIENVGLAKFAILSIWSATHVIVARQARLRGRLKSKVITCASFSSNHQWHITIKSVVFVPLSCCLWNNVPQGGDAEQNRNSMLTNKGKYGLKAMLHLAGLREGEIAQVAHIAEVNHIPKKFLDQIFADLRRAGLVHSKKGKAGGYALSKPANEIRVGQIIRALDGPIAPFLCASANFYRPCDDCDEQVCAVRRLMIEARNALSSVLDTQTLADMRARHVAKEAA